MHPLPEDLQILHEDDEVLALAKPAGLHVFPSRRGEQHSLWLLLKRIRPGLEEVGDLSAPAFVHRLDRGTSGVLLAAKTGPAYESLRKAFEAGEIEKVYLALAEGELAEPVEVDLPIGSRYRRSKKVQVQVPGRELRGVRPARTKIEPLSTAGGFTLCRVKIFTGVRHQIRAHLSHLRHPVAGDREYGASKRIAGLKARTFLHAWQVRLLHPASGSVLKLTCPLPADLEQILKGFGLEKPGMP